MGEKYAQASAADINANRERLQCKPNDDILGDGEALCPPPDHAEKCRIIAQSMAIAERLIYRLANGDRDAAIQLLGCCQTVPYDGKVLQWNLDKLIANVLG